MSAAERYCAAFTRFLHEIRTTETDLPLSDYGVAVLISDALYTISPDSDDAQETAENLRLELSYMIDCGLLDKTNGSNP